MIQKEVKVGKNGQVVIPKAMRTALKIEPGSKVTFTLENNKVTIKPFFDAVAVFQRIAKETNYNKEIDPHEAYEEELEERHKRSLSKTHQEKADFIVSTDTHIDRVKELKRKKLTASHT